MKPKLILLFLLAVSFSLQAQKIDKSEIVKQGWNFGALPAVTYDSDLGFQYGALVNLFEYGDGSRYPEYNHSLYFEVSRYTKGSSIYRFQYDSDRLFKGLQSYAEISYATDLLYNFYGYNGYDAVYNKAWTDEDDPDYRSRAFYNYDRKLFRLKFDLQGPLKGEELRWTGGLNFQTFKIASVNVSKINKGKSEADKLPDVEGLYDQYLAWGLIRDDEANGGNIAMLKGGLIYDTRDFRAIPERGVWSEALLEFVPELLGSESSFTRLCLTHRQYFPIVPNRKLTAAYRLSYQQVLSGHVPFYYLPQLAVTGSKGSGFDGLGGSKTLRGILRNRVIGEDIAFANLEIRWRLTEFQFKNNNFFIGLNGFVDGGKVTGKRELSFYPTFAPINTKDYLDNGAESWHVSYGTSLKVGMNENFIVTFDYGRATDHRDGSSGFYMGLNYLF
ncbi:BamA/TamA family outer membrane protein [Mangrovibacterium sp.]|uniref:Omp85 family outer membrane protein n=1 Tax=Mangrovibacterium sp. TaxID=1961364 RepID=UPI00356AF106